MALIAQLHTLKWNSQRQVNKLGFRFKWESRRQMDPSKTFNLKWAGVGAIVPKLLILKWDCDRVVEAAWHYRIYTLPASNRIYTIPININHI